MFQMRERDTRMAKQCKLNGEADPVGILAPACHELLIGAREGETSRHAVAIK